MNYLKRIKRGVQFLGDWFSEKTDDTLITEYGFLKTFTQLEEMQNLEPTTTYKDFSKQQLEFNLKMAASYLQSSFVWANQVDSEHEDLDDLVSAIYHTSQILARRALK